MPSVQSVQIGKVRTEGSPDSADVTDRIWTTGFYKNPIAGEVRIGKTGLDGDEVADTVNHGGIDKAVLCYAAQHYEIWRTEFSGLPWRGGAMGENLTIAGLDELSVHLGDRYQIGACVVEVSQPRQPCWKIARRWGIKTLTKAVAQTGRTGWYVRVVTAGNVTAGDEVNLIKRTQPEWPVSRANDILLGRLKDGSAKAELLALPELAKDWKQAIA